ncbi:MAG: hypothetical protein U9N77_13750 [Thermodesulfobacteriota bacterium]|nr:hypothetical protein [Thermodesulfobacteriota bacterium]
MEKKPDKIQKKPDKIIKKSDIAKKRTIAKYGMTLSMGALVATGFMQGKVPKSLHIGTGLALVGFSYWHYSLYQPKSKKD